MSELEGEGKPAQKSKKQAGTSARNKAASSKAAAKKQQQPEHEEEEDEQDAYEYEGEVRPLPPLVLEVEADAQGLPSDFDWRHYIRLYPGIYVVCMPYFVYVVFVCHDVCVSVVYVCLCGRCIQHYGHSMTSNGYNKQ